MKKKKTILLFILSIISLFFITISYAFITRTIKADNIFTFGNLKMQLLQTTIENGKEVEVVDKDSFDVTTESKISRKIKVKNLGKHPMYVRISLNFVATSSKKEDLNIQDSIIFDINNNDWIYKDGWYYYKEQLLPGKTTQTLIENITFDTEKLINNYDVNKFDLEINSYAVQSENNKGNVLQAKGWPTN